MELRCEKHRILIYPEDDIDETYLEDVLGLKNKGDTCLARRENAIGARGLSCLAYIEIKKLGK